MNEVKAINICIGKYLNKGQKTPKNYWKGKIICYQ